MRMIILTGCFALLAACQNKVDEPFSKTVRLKKDSRYAGILAKCKTITIDTLWVHCDESLEDTGISDNYPFKGILLDSIETALFPAEVLTGSTESASGVYACYSFAIDESHTGIIARTPSGHQSLSIRLFTLDHEQDTLTNFIELASFEGNEKESAEKIAWLYRNNSMKLNAYLWMQQTHDQPVKSEIVTQAISNEYYYVLDLSKSRYDTINKNAGALLKTFQAVVRN